MLKLTLPQLLPASLQKAIVLDTDVVFATDIARLWELFKNFNSEQASDPKELFRAKLVKR